MVLKVGSTGKEVEELQKFLRLTVDGDFGPKTESAVIEWQLNNRLLGDGIIGPKTWDAMGLASTDLSENVVTTANGLLINKHNLPKGEYNEGPTSKEYLFLHHTAGWHNPYKTIDQWGRDTRGTIATEFVLGGQSVKGNNTTYDGVVAQAFPNGCFAWHLGDNGSQHMHTHSVGVEVCNFGQLTNGKTYADTRVVDSQIVTLDKPFRGFSTWHKYSDTQLITLKKLILHIAKRDNIDVRDGLVDAIKSKGIKGFDFNKDAYYGKIKGMWTHTNTRKDKMDMFPQQELIDMLLSI